jgi:Protein of unknown function (DUF2924)
MSERRAKMTEAPELPKLADLPGMNASQLQSVHRRLFGLEHPVSNCQHLRRKIAWHLQAAADGGLPEIVRQYAIGVARSTELRARISQNSARRHTGVPLDQTATSRVVETRDTRLPMPGSLIVKTYKAETLVVKVLDGMFEYAGRRFSSLSSIAREITGTRWNGFAFFGLAQETRRGQK